MKLLLGWMAALWVCLTVEVARPDVFPHQSLTVPLVVVGITWMRSTSSLLLGGSVLLARWLLHTPAPPVDVGLAIAAAAWQIQRRGPTSARHESHSQETIIAGMIVLLTLVAARLPVERVVSRAEWLQLLGISLAVLLLSRGLFVAADAFGLRRRPL